MYSLLSVFTFVAYAFASYQEIIPKYNDIMFDFIFSYMRVLVSTVASLSGGKQSLSCIKTQVILVRDSASVIYIALKAL